MTLLKHIYRVLNAPAQMLSRNEQMVADFVFPAVSRGTRKVKKKREK